MNTRKRNVRIDAQRRGDCTEPLGRLAIFWPTSRVQRVALATLDKEFRETIELIEGQFARQQEAAADSGKPFRDFTKDEIEALDGLDRLANRAIDQLYADGIWN